MSRALEMILSFHPCFVADAQIILADRKLSAEDRCLIRSADAIILPQSCSLALYKACTKSGAYVFPDYELRFRYPGKVGQSLLFEKLKIPHPETKRWPSVKKFRDLQKDQSAPPHEMPFFLKADKSHEGEGVYFVTDEDRLETALGLLEKAGSDGFISQELIPCEGNVLRAVVLHKKIITYWKRPGTPDEAVTTVSHGARVDKKWKPELQEKGRVAGSVDFGKDGNQSGGFRFRLRSGPSRSRTFYFGNQLLFWKTRFGRLTQVLSSSPKSNSRMAERKRVQCENCEACLMASAS